MNLGALITKANQGKVSGLLSLGRTFYVSNKRMVGRVVAPVSGHLGKQTSISYWGYPPQ